MDETTALNDVTATTTITKKHDWKGKKGYMPLVVSLALLLGVAFYAGQIDGRTTRAAAAEAATGMDAANADAASNVGRVCAKSSGTFDSQTDFCYTCGSGKTLGYCWNSQNPQCPPACDNVQGVSGIGDNQCGGACDEFLNAYDAPNEELCKGMGCFWQWDRCVENEDDDRQPGSCGRNAA